MMDNKIHLDIQKEMQESVHVDSFHGYLGDESKVTGKHLGGGLFSNEDGTYSHDSGKKRVTFNNLESATEFAEGKRNRFKKDLKVAHETMTKHSPIDQEDTKTLQVYTNNLGDINHRLSQGKELSNKENEFVSSMDKTIAKHSAHDDLVVYSGTNKEHAEKLRGSKPVEHPGFISTSLSPNAARAFADRKGGDVVQIHVPKGHPGVYVSHLSGYEGEREFVLPRNTKLKIHKDKQQLMMHDSGDYIVHHATIEKE